MPHEMPFCATLADTGKADFVDGKMIFLQGSPELQEKNGIKLGRLSGIAAHYVPGYLQTQPHAQPGKPIALKIGKSR